MHAYIYLLFRLFEMGLEIYLEQWFVIFKFDNLIYCKLLVRDGKEWCMDVFDKFVGAGESVLLGEAVIRRYQVKSWITIQTHM